MPVPQSLHESGGGGSGGGNGSTGHSHKSGHLLFDGGLSGRRKGLGAVGWREEGVILGI